METTTENLRIVILSGAGLSADSGITTFRASDGLWRNHKVDEVATQDGFLANPKLVHDFYNSLRCDVKVAEPNAAHLALVELENRPGVEVIHITQNVDNLCERAGTKSTIHLHGELMKYRCIKCKTVLEVDGDITVASICPACGFKSRCGGLRPHIVWFGETPFMLDEVTEALENCDVFVAIGTSGQVYPAAGFVEVAKAWDAKTILINKDHPENLKNFDEIILGTASEMVPIWVSHIIKLLDEV